MLDFLNLKDYSPSNLPKDILVGVILAAVSIPISMGYAQIAGLPAIYGLYGSVFPIIIFSLLSSSRMFVFGVDAAPCVLVGSGIAGFGIVAESAEALRLIPVITLFVALWLLLFFALKFGKAIKYISAPVMGGFISGICANIILMQFPKLLGGTASQGEIAELIDGIVKTIPSTNAYSLLLGGISLLFLIVMKRYAPKIPAAIIVMAAGAFIMYFLHPDSWNIATLSAVDRGLPNFYLPNPFLSHELDSVDFLEVVKLSLAISLVVMAETLLAENNFAQVQGYRLKENREILTFAVCNASAAFTGCCPANGSISRTVLGTQYGATSRIATFSAGIAMIFLLLFGTGFIIYLPVPVLTAIIISALISAIEITLARRLWKISKREFLIFISAFFGVLIFGTIDGVVIGVILSFFSVLVATMSPLRDYRGVIPGKHHFYSIERNRQAFPISNVLIYKYTGNLHFANIASFVRDIEEGMNADTRVVVIDGAGINHIDTSAAERIEILYEKLKKDGIKFYFTEHIAHINDEFRRLGLGYLIEEGAVRRNIALALEDAGIHRPYPLDGARDLPEHVPEASPIDGMMMEEYEWAFGFRDVIPKQDGDNK